MNVFLLVGDHIPNINRCEYESYILGMDLNDRIWSVRRSEALQAADRARAIRRSNNSPLLMICLSDRYVLDHVADEEIPPTPGRPGQKWKQVADCASRFLEAHGFVATRLFYPPGVAGRVIGVGPNGCIRKVLNSQLGPTPSNPPEIKGQGQLRQLRKTLRKVAERSGATSREVPIAGGSMNVWETRNGAYEEWLSVAQPQPKPSPHTK